MADEKRVCAGCRFEGKAGLPFQTACKHPDLTVNNPYFMPWLPEEGSCFRFEPRRSEREEVVEKIAAWIEDFVFRMLATDNPQRADVRDSARELVNAALPADWGPQKKLAWEDVRALLDLTGWAGPKDAATCRVLAWLRERGLAEEE